MVARECPGTNQETLTGHTEQFLTVKMWRFRSLFSVKMPAILLLQRMYVAGQRQKDSSNRVMLVDCLDDKPSCVGQSQQPSHVVLSQQDIQSCKLYV